MDSQQGTVVVPQVATTVAGPAVAVPSQTERRGVHVTSIILQLISGGGSGVITKTAVAPLERIKILLQLQGMQGLAGSGQVKYRGIVQTGHTILREEGFWALYKGNGANVARIVPVYALKFMFNDTLKELLRKPGQSMRELSGGQLLAAGTLAGLIQNVLTCPLEVIRTRLTLGQEMKGVQYKGIIDCAKRIVAEEGISATYKGMGAILVTAAPYVGLQMTCFDLFKRYYPKDEKGNSSVFWTLMSGASAGLVAQTVTYPGDTIKRRMQANGIAGAPREYKHTWDCVSKTVRKEGVGALYKGLKANMVKCLPEAAIQFAAYDFLKYCFGV